LLGNSYAAVAQILDPIADDQLTTASTSPDDALEVEIMAKHTNQSRLQAIDLSN
jgi:hypothetical protein